MHRFLGAWVALLVGVSAGARAGGDDAAVKKLLGKLSVGDAQTTRAFVQLGAKAAPALVGYTASELEFPATRWTAANVLGQIGAPAVPAIREGLKKKSSPYLLSALRQMRSAAKEALPEVLAVLNQGPAVADKGVSFALAVDVVGNLGSDAREAVPELVKGLAQKKDTKATEPVSPFAVHLIVALGKIGPAAGDALPRLQELADNGAPTLRVHARQSIKQIKGK